VSLILFGYEKRRAANMASLQEAMNKVKLLSGFLPICSACKKIRDDHGYWDQMESYIAHHSEAEFSHSICPDCVSKLYPEWEDVEDEQDGETGPRRSAEQPTINRR